MVLFKVSLIKYIKKLCKNIFIKFNLIFLVFNIKKINLIGFQNLKPITSLNS